MANIAISELQTEATKVDKNDLFLVSKISEDGTSFTSAKIKASQLGDISTRKVVELQNIYVYISPDGNDNNLDKQYEYFGTDQQSTYPLFSLNAATRLIAKINQIWSINKIAHIICKPGTYLYNESQTISGNYRDYGSYIKIQKNTSITGDIIFKVNYEYRKSSNIFFNCYCNTIFQSVKIVGRDDYKTKYDQGYSSYSIVAWNSILTIYGAEISEFSAAIQGNSGSEINLRSNFTNIGTLDTIEDNYEPIYIHDCLVGIQLYDSLLVDLHNWIRIDVSDYPVNFNGSCQLANVVSRNGVEKVITRLDFRSRTKKRLIFSQNACQSRFQVNGNDEVFEMNLFNDVENYTEDPKLDGFKEALGDKIEVWAGHWFNFNQKALTYTNLNVNKF